MKLGIIGLPGSGKTTVFRALTGGIQGIDRKSHQEAGLGMVKVEDPRLDFLRNYHKPKKVTAVTVQYTDIPGIGGEGVAANVMGDKILAHLRPVDALLHCVRLFDSFSLGNPKPIEDFQRVEDEMILSDLGIVEKRLERVSRDLQRGKKELAEEHDALQEAQKLLDQGKPLRLLGDLPGRDKLKGFSFLSEKPELILLNSGDEKDPNSVKSVVDQLRLSVWRSTRHHGRLALCRRRG